MIAGVLLFMVGCLMSPLPQSETRAESNALRIVQDGDGYVVETFQDWPGWRPLSCRRETLEEARSKVDYLESVRRGKKVVVSPTP